MNQVNKEIFNDLFEDNNSSTMTMKELVSNYQEDLIDMLTIENECNASAQMHRIVVQLRFRDSDLKDYLAEVEMSSSTDDYDLETFKYLKERGFGEWQVNKLLKLEENDYGDCGVELSDYELDGAITSVAGKAMMRKLQR